MILMLIVNMNHDVDGDGAGQCPNQSNLGHFNNLPFDHHLHPLLHHDDNQNDEENPPSAKNQRFAALSPLRTQSSGWVPSWPPEMPSLH